MNEIVQITSIFGGNEVIVLGLGDDNQMYEWDYLTGKWMEYKLT